MMYTFILLFCGLMLIKPTFQNKLCNLDCELIRRPICARTSQGTFITFPSKCFYNGAKCFHNDAHVKYLSKGSCEAYYNKNKKNNKNGPSNTGNFPEPIGTQQTIQDPPITDSMVRYPNGKDPTNKGKLFRDQKVRYPSSIDMEPVIRDPRITDPMVRYPIGTDPRIIDHMGRGPIIPKIEAYDPETNGTDGFDLEKGDPLVLGPVVPDQMSPHQMGPDQMGQSPVVHSPMVQGPMGQNPMGRNPMEQSPMEQSPMEQIPIGQSPIVQSPKGQSPMGQSKIGQSKIGQSPVDQRSKGQSPVDQSPMGQSSMVHTPKGQGPMGQLPMVKDLNVNPKMVQGPINQEAILIEPKQKRPMTPEERWERPIEPELQMPDLFEILKKPIGADSQVPVIDEENEPGVQSPGRQLSGGNLPEGLQKPDEPDVKLPVESLKQKIQMPEGPERQEGPRGPEVENPDTKDEDTIKEETFRIKLKNPEQYKEEKNGQPVREGLNKPFAPEERENIPAGTRSPGRKSLKDMNFFWWWW